MPGPRLPTDVVKARGKKHLSRAEEQERRQGEVNVPAADPKNIKPPKWLGAKLTKEFDELANRLIELNLYTELDGDVLAQYLVTKERWVKADKKAASAIAKKDEKLAKEWTNIQAAYFRQCRQCAGEMGLSISSRCRLVVPDGSAQKTEENNPFLQLIQGGLERNA